MPPTPLISEVAMRLRDRKLLKCFDIRETIANKIDPKWPNLPDKIVTIDKCCAVVKAKLTNSIREVSTLGLPKLLVDAAERSPYRPVDQSKGPLNQIMVRSGNGFVDLKERSGVVSALQTFKLLRVYYSKDDTEIQSEVNSAITEGIAECLKI